MFDYIIKLYNVIWPVNKTDAFNNIWLHFNKGIDNDRMSFLFCPMRNIYLEENRSLLFQRSF